MSLLSSLFPVLTFSLHVIPSMASDRCFVYVYNYFQVIQIKC